ncbi:S1 family peptidase [Streptomyces sp. M19]
MTRGAQGGFVSAGHCGTTGDTTTGADRTPRAPSRAPASPATTTPGSPREPTGPAAPGARREGHRRRRRDRVAAGPVGSAVCRSGSTSGWHCGTVEQVDAAVTYPEGAVNGVTRTSVCAEPGDSGGSFLSGDQAQGVTSGGSGDCATGGTTYFQPVNPILSTYGLTLATG